MKVIDLNEAKANLEQYARDCQYSPVIVTVEGRPSFEMIPIRTDDPEFIDRLLEQNEAFRHLAEDRRREADEGRVSTLEDVRRRLGVGP
jgi:antitoxin (DNA-binding transcriptional repressor) of toxin-antitoxin stability system